MVGKHRKHDPPEECTQLVQLSEVLNKCNLKRLNGIRKTAAEFNTLSTQLPSKLLLPVLVRYPRPGVCDDSSQLGASMGLFFCRTVPK